MQPDDESNRDPGGPEPDDHTLADDATRDFVDSQQAEPTSPDDEFVLPDFEIVDVDAPSDDDEPDALDVALGPRESVPDLPIQPGPGSSETTVSDAGNLPVDVPTGSADAAGEGTPASTLPLLTQDGNRPSDLDQILRGLELWEEAAAEVPGDPHFTPVPTNKPRADLLSIGRGPLRPLVWLDREPMTPVLYSPEAEPDRHAFESIGTGPADDGQSADQVGDAQQELGISRPPLVVTVARAPRHFLDALDQRAGQFEQCARSYADEAIQQDRWWQRCQERALYGS